VAKNFKRALKHLKSNHKTTKLDEKKEMLNEIPTMHTGGVYSKNPAGFRYDPPSPAKRFVPDVDGNWPAGVPGTPGATEYIRPQGYWVNDSDWDTKLVPNLSNDSILESPTNTDGFIDPDTGTVKTNLPPNSRHFILGPLVDGYTYNHGYDDYTTIGYIQKDTRQFVLLGTIQGHWNTNPIVQLGTTYNPRQWDGTSGQFTAYNASFTLAMAQWFKDRFDANDYTKDFPYFYSGGVAQQTLDPQPPGSPGNMPGGNAAGSGGGGNGPGDGDGKATSGSGGSPDTGTETPQGDPEGGDAASQGFPWGLGDFIKKKWDEFYNNAQDFGDKLDKGIEDFVDDAMDWAQDKSQDVLDWAGDFFGKDSDLWEYKDAIGDKINALDNWVEDNITDPSGTDRQLFTDFAETVSNWVGEAQQWVTGQDITTSVNLMNDFNQHALDMTNDPNTPGSSWDNPKDVTDRIDKGDLNALNEVTKSENWQNELDKYNNGEISKEQLERNLTSQFEDVIYARPGLDQSIHNGSEITNIDEVIAGGNPDIGKQYDFNEGDSVAEGEDDVATYAYSQIMNLPLDAFGTGGNAGAVALYAKYLGLSNADRHNGILNMPPMVMKVTVGDNKSESFRLSKHKTYITEQKITYKPIGKKSKIKAKFEAFKKKHYGKDNLSLYDFLPSFASVSKKSTQKSIKESNTYNKKRILREITQPLKEIKELPKTQKLKKYRPNFKGKYKAQNTPNVTSSKKSDEMVKAKNAAGQTWRTKDKYWGGYESQERMNVVYDNVGHGNQYWDKIVNENLHKKNIKNRKVQEELNIIAHEKAMRRLDSTFISPFKNIEEQETYDNKIKDPLFSKVADRLKKEIDYENKPAKKGYPNEAPPEMVNGFHPNYGKRYKYDKLDPQSAESMPVQGNPEIDANVQKALDKRAKNRKIKNLKIDVPTVENVSWKETLKKKNLEELKKGFKKFKHDLKEGMTTAGVMTLTRPAEGDTAIDTVSPIDAASFTALADVPQAGDNNIANVGTVIRDSGTGSGEDGGFNVGGQYLAFQGTGDAYNNARFAALSPIDSSAVDTFSITAIVGNDVNGGEDPDLASEALFLMYKTPGMSQPRFLFQKPDGSSGEGTGTIINSPLSHDGGLNNYSIAIPEYARAKGTQFVLYQNFSSSADHDNYGITQIKLQRRAPVNVVVPLDDPAAISFINVGTTEGDPKKRKKKVQDQLDASNEYVTSQFGDDFPTGANLTSDDDIQASPIGKDEVSDRFANLTDQQKVSQSDEFIADYIQTFNNDTYNNPESLAILDRAIELNPKNTDAYFYRSFAHFDNQNYEDALKDADSILEVNPNDSDVSYMKAMIYKEKGDLELSLEEIKKSLETYPDDPYLEDMKVEVEEQIVQEYQAKQVPPDANEEGGVVKRQTYYDEVSKNLAPEEDNTEDQQLVSTNLAQAKDLMSSTNYRIGRDGVFSKGAIDLLQDAYAVDPNNPEILSNLGVALMMGRQSYNKKDGAHYLERAQALDPSIKFDFNIKSWDRYDGEESPAYAGPRIDKLGNLPYRYAREIIKNLPDQSTAKGATYGATRSDYKSSSKYYTDEAKGKSTQDLQRMLVSAAREIEDNKYWMEDLSRHPTFSGNTDVVGVPGYVLGGTKWTGALNGVTQEDWLRENEIMDNWPTDKAGYYADGWREQWEKTRDTYIKYQADSRSKLISGGVKNDIEKYQAYYDEYMRRGEPDAIEKVDVPEAGKFIETAQKEIIEKAISEPEKLFKLSKEQGESLRKVLTPQGGQGGDSLEYTANLPFALGISILTGKPMELFVSDAEAIKIAQDINAEELAKVLRIDNPVSTTAREAIQPSEGKTDQVITSLFGKQGGLYFNYDTETKQLYIESRKTLRSTSGGESIDTFRGDLVGDILFQLPNATGTGTRFTDIPVPTTDQLNDLGAKFVYNTFYDPFMKAQATFDALKKTGGNPIQIKNVIFDALAGKIKNPAELDPNAPRIWNEGAGKMMNMYDRSIAGMKQTFEQNTIVQMAMQGLVNVAETNVNAIAANMVAIRKVLTDIGVPASDIEKFGGAYGMTYSSTPINYDDLPDDVKAVIDAATGTGIEEPKPVDEPVDEPKDDSGLGSTGGYVGGDATAAATAASEKDKDKNKKKNESTLYKKVIGKTLLKS